MGALVIMVVFCAIFVLAGIMVGVIEWYESILKARRLSHERFVLTHPHLYKNR